MSDATSVIMYGCPGPESLCLGHSTLAFISFLVPPIQAQNLLLLWQLHHHPHQVPGCGRGSQQVLQLRQDGDHLMRCRLACGMRAQPELWASVHADNGGCGHRSDAYAVGYTTARSNAFVNLCVNALRQVQTICP